MVASAWRPTGPTARLTLPLTPQCSAPAKALTAALHRASLAVSAHLKSVRYAHVEIHWWTAQGQPSHGIPLSMQNVELRLEGKWRWKGLRLSLHIPEQELAKRVYEGAICQDKWMGSRQSTHWLRRTMRRSQREPPICRPQPRL